MNRISIVLTASLLFASVSIFAAENVGGAAGETDRVINRLCSLQGREIALRISEEVSAELTSIKRNQIAEIAAQVCQDYAANASTFTVIERPSSAAVAGRSVSEDATVNADSNQNPLAEEEDSGLFGDMKIIDPEDRVRRPGLKRR